MRRFFLTVLACLVLTACGDARTDAPPEDEPTTGGEPGPSEPGPSEPGPSEPSAGGPECGGIAGTPCPEGQWCDLEGGGPDAGGVCRPEGTCDDPADCAQQDLVHVMCVGEWTCVDGRCAWECQ